MSIPSWSRWLRLLLPVTAIAGCVQVLGIEPAEVDPSFEQSLAAPNQLAGSEPVGECIAFDNARLTLLGADGRLPPLPEAP